MKGEDLYLRAKRRIPGGTQLLSKRPEMFLPDQWPAYYDRAQGCEVWDLDGRKLVDMSLNGIGACALGFADPDVDAAVVQAIAKGTASTLSCPEEVELAELLCAIHPWAEMVRYARGGGEAMAMAVRIARAATGRDRIAFCGYHGWEDWYLAANLASDKSLDGHLLPGLQPAGVPRGLSGTALPFGYNQKHELDAILAQHGDEIAAVVMEPVRYADPEPGFLEHARDTAHRIGAVFVVDEVTAAFRTNVGGAHLRLGVEPDIAVFAKALGNGYPIAAIIGCASVMEAAQRSFISSTNWTERVGPTAAIATLRKMQRLDVPTHLVEIGNAVRRTWTAAAERYRLKIHVNGVPPLSSFVLDHGDASAAMSTLFTQEMLARGFLASKALYATYAHTREHVDRYTVAVDETFAILAKGDAASRLRGPVQHAGFRRLA